VAPEDIDKHRQQGNLALEVAILDPTPVPMGDNCASPIPLTPDQAVLVSLSDKQAEVRASCESTGPDVVFSLHLDEAQDVLIQADAEDMLAIAALQSECGNVQTERGCRKGGPLQTRLQNVGPGDYFVIVDSPTAQSISVEISTFPPTPTTPVTGNDNCLTAKEITGSGGMFTGDTRTLLSDYTAPCGGDARSRDAVFKLVLTERKHVVAVLDSGFDGVLHRMRDARTTPDVCTNIVSEACNDEMSGGMGAELDEVLSPGTYYYVVDGFGTINEGYYQFDVAITAP